MTSSTSTIDNLESAEELLLKVIDVSQELVELLQSQEGLDTQRMSQNGSLMLTTLEELRERIAREIPKLVMYIPFERSSYGAKKDSQIATQKLSVARTYLKDILT